jgi:hypothetical protein
VHVKGGESRIAVAIVSRRKVYIDASGVPQPIALELEFLNAAMLNIGYPFELRRIMKFSDDEK